MISFDKLLVSIFAHYDTLYNVHTHIRCIWCTGYLVYMHTFKRIQQYQRIVERRFAFDKQAHGRIMTGTVGIKRYLRVLSFWYQFISKEENITAKFPLGRVLFLFILIYRAHTFSFLCICTEQHFSSSKIILKSGVREYFSHIHCT